MTDVTYRLAMPSDYEQMSAVMRSASLAAADGDTLQRLLERPEVMEVEAELIGGNQVVVAADGKAVVGFGSIKAEEGNDAKIADLFVVPERWRQGIGRALVAALEREALAWAATRLHVTAHAQATGFYLSLGFEHVGEMKTELGPVASVMAKRIAAVPT